MGMSSNGSCQPHCLFQYRTARSKRVVRYPTPSAYHDTLPQAIATQERGAISYVVTPRRQPDAAHGNNRAFVLSRVEAGESKRKGKEESTCKRKRGQHTLGSAVSIEATKAALSVNNATSRERRGLNHLLSELVGLFRVRRHARGHGTAPHDRNHYGLLSRTWETTHAKQKTGWKTQDTKAEMIAERVV
eukprot:336650-Rhodomonas_salina.1